MPDKLLQESGGGFFDLEDGSGDLLLEDGAPPPTVLETKTRWRKTTLTILSGETESEELNLQAFNVRRLKNLTFIAPTLAEVVKVHIGDQVGGTYEPLNDGFGNDVTLLSGKSQVQRRIGAGALKLVAATAAANDRVFNISGVALTPIAR